MKRVLCYGDSNTWGYTPGTSIRYVPEVRWTGVAARRLGTDYCVIEEGLNGRTTVQEDPYNELLNGKTYLGVALLSHRPLDWVVLALGTNDLKFTNAYGAAKGAGELVRRIKNANIVYHGSTPVFPNEPRILLVSPPLLGVQWTEQPERSELLYGRNESQKFAQEFYEVACNYNVSFLDAAQYAEPSETDGIHLEADAHRALGEAIADCILAVDSKDRA